MTTATILCDNTYVTVPHEAGSGNKAAAEPSGEGPQQRFSDVLPVAQAALETPTDPPKAAAGSGNGASDTQEERGDWGGNLRGSRLVAGRRRSSHGAPTGQGGSW